MYTIDLDVEKLSVNYVENAEFIPKDVHEKKIHDLEKRKKKVAKKNVRDEMRKDLLLGTIKTYMILDTNDDIKQMRETYTAVRSLSNSS